MGGFVVEDGVEVVTIRGVEDGGGCEIVDVVGGGCQTVDDVIGGCETGDDVGGGCETVDDDAVFDLWFVVGVMEGAVVVEDCEAVIAVCGSVEGCGEFEMIDEVGGFLETVDNVTGGRDVANDGDDGRDVGDDEDSEREGFENSIVVGVVEEGVVVEDGVVVAVGVGDGGGWDVVGGCETSDVDSGGRYDDGVARAVVNSDDFDVGCFVDEKGGDNDVSVVDVGCRRVIDTVGGSVIDVDDVFLVVDEETVWREVTVDGGTLEDCCIDVGGVFGVDCCVGDDDEGGDFKVDGRCVAG